MIKSGFVLTICSMLTCGYASLIPATLVRLDAACAGDQQIDKGTGPGRPGFGRVSGIQLVENDRFGGRSLDLFIHRRNARLERLDQCGGFLLVAGQFGDDFQVGVHIFERFRVREIDRPSGPGFQAP